MTRRRPEILAPAGDLDSMKAALASGADAIYFGLDEGFNARARAENFSLATLPGTLALVHRAGARAYLTLNTLVFEPELPVVEDILRRIAEAGVDALIVQDPAVALVARAVCPQMEVHASTQMTISSAEGARFAKGLGATRVVVPRELSVAEIRRLAAETDVELEVFIHGALCMSWSGQCLTSEAWGGRSANRGQCAQSCRLPYDLVVDGQTRELGDVQYLLSPKDLAGVMAVPQLVEIGVHSLKIEGRQKGPQYVATAVQGYRRWVDGVSAGKPDTGALRKDLADMTLSYSRGFSHGFFAGSDHQTLVEGRFPKHRGAFLGRVESVHGRDVRVVDDEAGRPWTGALGQESARPDAPVGKVSSPLETEAPVAADLSPRPGMGVVFDDGHPEDKHEPGGPLFRVERKGRGWVLGFGNPGPDLARVKPGQRVWVTSDPSLAKRTEELLERGEPEGRVPLELTVSGAAGTPLTVVGRARGGHVSAVASEVALAEARGGGIDAALLRDKLAALGGTPFTLTGLDTSGLATGLHLPVSEMKALRRRLVAELAEAVARGPVRTVNEGSTLESLRASLRERVQPAPRAVEDVRLLPLCRTDEQLEAVIAAGLPEVELDWMELVGLQRAVERARAAGLRVTIATVRVQKPGEEGYDARIAKLKPDAVLVRHWGAMMHFLERPPAPGEARPALHADFSLNVTNSVTALHLLGLGLDTLTFAHDLDAVQLGAMLEHLPAERFTVAVHHHISTFHTEHCVYSHTLSHGRDYRSCGRPCEKHRLSLRDHKGLEHPVVVDVGCRNTVFNAQAQSAASLVPSLLARGVRRFRVEFVRESREEASRVLAAYQELLAGRISPAEAIRRAAVHEQFGVTKGTMKVLSPRLSESA
ncbi:U32 family peptidase [Corallococcus macrosporus]|uniref:U32 family peptidase n=1 Tax=Myxococcus fulvus (strain ATCC BAA-855 / HW-1) TaxID=483219 RepID=F8CMN6_MYXFH|nr:U32 family peptidase [Corallococcus macrosporus]AEI65315.1 U32 family peptidase [Corallococcus macrosporus]